VPQGVLCECTFCTHSWSWVEITHLCHPLHNVPVRFFFLFPTRPATSLNLSSPPPPASRQQGAGAAVPSAVSVAQLVSEGRIDDKGRLQCVYHNWCFDGAGACNRTPAW
jgi:hypothetical protein